MNFDLTLIAHHLDSIATASASSLCIPGGILLLYGDVTVTPLIWHTPVPGFARKTIPRFRSRRTGRTAIGVITLRLRVSQHYVNLIDFWLLYSCSLIHSA